ncbi:hypothetical protein [Mycoplasma parvum]|uniref:Uncharacterized protein n=1 Tax=Mycoplasma parvum str. Indiana TaxID=1403316 RepID=U5NC72_9MOLU|nr:hypothetical protein [Mycoplasma parvum]AGX88895.1 hypothetical protein PRV_00645 [Mycoplasma parvum str. Indiana]
MNLKKVVMIIDGNAIARKCFHAVISSKKDKKFSRRNDSPPIKNFLNF